MTMLSYDYPILGVFWTMLWFFLWIAWIILLFRVFADIFRSRDMGGWGKALWSIFVLVVPFLGVFVYLIARGHSMADRDVAEAQAQQAAFESYVQDVAGTGAGTADELAKLADLKAQGVITDAEFAQQKSKLLA
jgi:putative oligomerization/nucleic acid binding protein/phospholipase D-like protein